MDLKCNNIVIVNKKTKPNPKQWKPRRNNLYCYPKIGEVRLFNSCGDKSRLRLGLVFKTDEEAMACTQKILKDIKTK